MCGECRSLLRKHEDERAAHADAEAMVLQELIASEEAARLEAEALVARANPKPETRNPKTKN